VALLNIVNNIPNIDLGENLRSFKEFTMPFTPALRGDAINNFEFVKRIHNSFARCVGILEILERFC
jgi:ubiquitin carboxyl-terminal hydrolase L5